MFNGSVLDNPVCPKCSSRVKVKKIRILEYEIDEIFPYENSMSSGMQLDQDYFEKIACSASDCTLSWNSIKEYLVALEGPNAD